MPKNLAVNIIRRTFVSTKTNDMTISQSLRNTINELEGKLRILNTKRSKMMMCDEARLLDSQIRTINEALEALDEQRFSAEWDEANA